MRKGIPAQPKKLQHISVLGCVQETALAGIWGTVPEVSHCDSHAGFDGHLEMGKTAWELPQESYTREQIGKVQRSRDFFHFV